MPKKLNRKSDLRKVMEPPSSGVKVRMYRQGHGDCFLLCIPKADGTPFYLLIDCGLWSKSEIKPNQTIDKIIADIGHATGCSIDVVLVTHEHMDHVNGFLKKDPLSKTHCFAPIEIGQLWLAWTEDPEDKLANELRERFNDTLLALVGADERLEKANHAINSSKRALLRKLLSFEIGDEGLEGDASASDNLRHSLREIAATEPALSFRDKAEKAIAGITNKKAIKYLRDKIDGDPVYLNPERGPYALAGVQGMRVFAFGPPRDPEKLLSLNPKGDEEFHIGIDGSARSFAAALRPDKEPSEAGCFPSRFGITRQHLDADVDEPLKQRIVNAYGRGVGANYSPNLLRQFFKDNYGPAERSGSPTDWRRIDDEWLLGADALALRLNSEVNNTSAVIAIELPGTKKVLLFSGDAQRGSWISWSDLSWDVDGKKVTARDLLSRTVFYKVGHHGSHNATLKGVADGEKANLSWMALGAYAEHFVAVIPANESWALEKQGWHHPLKSIQEALIRKSRGRVFRSDIDSVQRPSDIDAKEWEAFQRVETDLYFEYTVLDN